MNLVSRARRLGIPAILIQSAEIDGILSDLVESHLAGMRECRRDGHVDYDPAIRELQLSVLQMIEYASENWHTH